MIVWVTGASSGLGKYTAEALRNDGHTVIAGARSFSDCEKDGIRCLPLDVTNDESVAAFADAALAVSPRVDALIQCAGILQMGPCEETTAADYSHVMDTDFIGMVRMNNLVLPRMRAQGGGRIILFSSVNGLLGIPFQSAYTAAKHAIEGYAECLEMECSPFGIQVCLVEPGDHRGGSQTTRLRTPLSSGSPYTAPCENAISTILHDEEHGSDPAVLGRRIAALLSRRSMPLRFRVVIPAERLAVWLHDLLSPRSFGAFLRLYYTHNRKS